MCQTSKSLWSWDCQTNPKKRLPKDEPYQKNPNHTQDFFQAGVKKKGKVNKLRKRSQNFTNKNDRKKEKEWHFGKMKICIIPSLHLGAIRRFRKWEVTGRIASPRSFSRVSPYIPTAIIQAEKLSAANANPCATDPYHQVQNQAPSRWQKENVLVQPSAHVSAKSFLRETTRSRARPR